MIAQFVQKHGNDLQRQRFAAGHLPEAELRDLVRSILFQPLDEFERFKRLEPHHAKHTSSCRGVAEAVVEFKTDDDYQKPLTEEQRQLYKGITLATRPIQQYLIDIRDFVATRVRAHLVECCECGSKKTRLSAMVLVRLGGMTLTREYAL